MDEIIQQLVEAAITEDKAAFKKLFDQMMVEKIQKKIREKALEMGVADPFTELADDVE